MSRYRPSHVIGMVVPVLLAGGLLLLCLSGYRPRESASDRNATENSRVPSYLEPITAKPAGISVLSVGGHVSDSDSKSPIEGAMVTCSLPDGNRLSVTTNKDGSYSMTVPFMPTEISAIYQHPVSGPEIRGSATLRTLPVPDFQGHLKVEITLRLLHKVTFSGIVQDNRMRRVSNADVQIETRSPSNYVLREHVRSRGDGTYDLSAFLIPGEYELSASSKTHKSNTTWYSLAHYSAGLRVSIDFTLEVIPFISGRVLSPSGQVVRGASIRLIVRHREGASNEMFTSKTNTSASGEFSLGLENEGEVALHVLHPIYENVVIELGYSDKLSDAALADIQFSKERTGVLASGTITNSLGEAIVPDHFLLLKSNGTANQDSLEVPVESDGSFRIILDPADSYTILIKKRGYQNTLFRQVTSTSIQGLRFELKSRQ